MRRITLVALATTAAASACEGTIEVVEACGTETCYGDGTCSPVDGVWAEWADWAACDCSTQTRKRARPGATHAFCGGAPLTGAQMLGDACTDEEVEKCNLPAAPVVCSVGEWTPWSECECGKKQVYRTRVIEESENCGASCEADLKETKPCDEWLCKKKIDCSFHPWTEWSKCPVTCDGGQQIRTRAVDVDASGGGAACEDDTEEVRSCAEECCPLEEAEDCAWGEWSEWGGCTASCDGGSQKRSREVAVYTKNGGKPCPMEPLEEFQHCNYVQCVSGDKVDGKWGEWSEWSGCSHTCGGGLRHRHRDVASWPEGGGKITGDFDEFDHCADEACEHTEKVDCEFIEWTEWSECSCKCNGKREQARDIAKHAFHGGKVCEGALTRVEACNVPPDAEGCKEFEIKKPCEFAEWEEWSECSKSCDGGVAKRVRETLGPDYDESCTGSTHEVKSCNVIACILLDGKAADCVWEEWTEWTDCTVQCGGGQRTATRGVKTPAVLTGESCAAKDAKKIEACNIFACEDNAYCVWSAWEEWSPCSTTCDGGTRTRIKILESTEDKPLLGGYLNSYQKYELQHKVDLLREKLDGSSSLLMAAVYGTGIGAVVLAVTVGAVVRPLGRRSAIAPEEEELLELPEQQLHGTE